MSRLEVITGPMYSGKSEELIRRLRRATYAKQTILVVKPRFDTRTKEFIASRKTVIVDGKKVEGWDEFPAVPICERKEFDALIAENNPDLLGIDEAQFFGTWLPEAVEELLYRSRHAENFRIIVSGLDVNARKKPWPVMPELMAMADEVLKLSAICIYCGRPAPLTTKVAGKGGQDVEIGNTETYVATCRACHKVHSE